MVRMLSQPMASVRHSIISCMPFRVDDVTYVVGPQVKPADWQLTTTTNASKVMRLTWVASNVSVVCFVAPVIHFWEG